MKIQKFIKQKNSQYKIILEDDEELIVHENLIFKYDLLLTKKIDSSMMKDIMNENIYYEVYDEAVKYLGKKMRCKKEVLNFLKNKDYDTSLIERVIEKLQQEGYLNDELFAEAYINDKIYLSMDGPNKISQELQNLSIKDELIKSKLVKFNATLQQEKIEKIVSKNLKSNRNNSTSKLKMKLNALLINKGYDSVVIKEVLNKIKVDDTDIAKKEYEKIYQKLSKKYSGRELELKVKQKMYQKGFGNYE